MKRKIYDQLLLWKEKRKGKSAMMIEGARRVGKSYIVKEFAQREYKSYILIDFFKVGDDVKDLFNLIAKSKITSRHNISPIEVKSSAGFTTVSLEKCIKKYATHLAQAYIVHTGDVEVDGAYLYIPLYMVTCL
jgi:AAA+ ATPase superfamily predicted ATPase